MPSGDIARRQDDPRAADSIMRAIDFAEENLSGDIGLSDMARAACYSPFYFSRVFIQATGHAPYDYLMRRRTAVAAGLTVSGSASLIDISLSTGFGGPDGLARAFRRCFGMAPSQARRQGAFPAALARTRIGRELVEESLERPFGPPAETGSPEIALVDGGDAAGLHFDVAQRDGSLAPANTFSGRLAAPGEAASYPWRGINVAPGTRARFGISGGPGRLGFLLEFAYRTWLPLSGHTALPAFDIVEWDGDAPVALSLHLGAPPATGIQEPKP